MSKVIMWKCDACGKEFREGQHGFKKTLAVLLKVPIEQTMYTTEELDEFSFPDVCDTCRNSLRDFIKDWMEPAPEEC